MAEALIYLPSPNHFRRMVITTEHDARGRRGTAGAGEPSAPHAWPPGRLADAKVNDRVASVPAGAGPDRGRERTG